MSDDPLAAHKRLIEKLPVRTHTLMDDKPTGEARWQPRRPKAQRSGVGSGGHNKKPVIVQGRKFESVRDACDRLGLHHSTLARWVRRGLVKK